MARPKKRSKTKKILFAVEIIVLLVFIGGLYVYGQLMSRMDKTNTQKLDTQKVQVNERRGCKEKSRKDFFHREDKDQCR